MIQYFRGDGNHPIGIMVAIYDEAKNVVKIGWSKCNKKDKFDKERGLKIARSRAESCNSELPIPSSREFLVDEIETVRDGDLPDRLVKVPVSVIVPNLLSQYEIFIERVVTYFKSVPIENFNICGPVAEDNSSIYSTLVRDARNHDLDRQAIRKAEKV